MSGVKSNKTDILIRRGKFGRRDTQREEGHMKMKAEIRVMLSLSKGIEGPPEAGKNKEGSSPRNFRGNIALPTSLFQASSLHNCKRISVPLSHTVCGTGIRQLQEMNVSVG